MRLVIDHPVDPLPGPIPLNYFTPTTPPPRNLLRALSNTLLNAFCLFFIFGGGIFLFFLMGVLHS